jgi:hypothetical protein
MPEQSFPDLDALIRQIEARAIEFPDPLAILLAMLKMVIASDADPYLLAGALVEGIAATISARIPPERQGEVAVEIVRLLGDRLETRGAI